MQRLLHNREVQAVLWEFAMGAGLAGAMCGYAGWYVPCAILLVLAFVVLEVLTLPYVWEFWKSGGSFRL